MNNLQRFLPTLYGILFGCIVLLDQLTKRLALLFLEERVYFLPFLSGEVTINRGISWGMLHADSSVLFGIVTAGIAAITIGVAIYAVKQFQAGASILAEVLIVAGSCANILDRIHYGGVVDFILVSFGSWDFPTFNIADICIVLGVMLYVWRLHSQRVES